MAGKRIPDLDPLSGAASANDDKLVIYDSSTTTTKRIDRSQLAAGLVGDLPFTPTGFVSATTIPTAVTEVITDLSAAGGAALIGNTPAGTISSGTVQGAINEIVSDLAASSGTSLVGHIATGAGATARTVQSKLRDVVGIQDFGAVSPAATALATVSAALTAAGVGGVLNANTEIDIGAATTDNPGVDITGELGIYFEGATGGRRLLNKPGRDASLYQWGRENLVRWLEGLRAGETLKVALVGDSNTEGYVGATLATYLDSLPNVSLTNFAVSGTQIEQWRTASAPYNTNGKSLADVISYDPDLIVMCWGTNDPVVGGRTAAQFSTSLSQALTTLRASLDVNACSIAMLTPNAMGDTSDRDELWSLRLRPIIRAMTERFDCAFFDKNALFPNSAIDLAAGAMQNKWLDSARVHTATLSTNILAAMIAEWLVPRELWGMTWDNIPTKASANLPSTYPPGLTLTRMSDGPFDGFTATFNPISTGGHFPIQINWAYTGVDSRFAWRVALGGSWSAWTTNGVEPLVVVSSVPAGYSVTAGASGLNTQRFGNLISLSGRLTLSPAAQVVTSTTLANIATVAHRPIFNIQDAVVVALNAGGTVERLRADVTTAGNIVVRESSVMVDATTVSINLTYRAP